MLLALLVLAIQDNAEETFKKFEKQYMEAKSLTAKFKLDVKEPGQEEAAAAVTGTVRLKSGDKFIVTMTMSEKSSKNEMEAKSDGKQVVETSDGRRREKPTREGTGRFFASALCRSGYGLLLFLTRSDRDKTPSPDEFAKPKDFKLSKEGDDLLLEYTLVTEGLGDVRLKLWLTSALVPKKRVLTVKDGDKEGTFTETYEDVSTDEIPDSEFEHKK